jgi:hypothetical protein
MFEGWPVGGGAEAHPERKTIEMSDRSIGTVLVFIRVLAIFDERDSQSGWWDMPIAQQLREIIGVFYRNLMPDKFMKSYAVVISVFHHCGFRLRIFNVFTF